MDERCTEVQDEKRWRNWGLVSTDGRVPRDVPTESPRRKDAGDGRVTERGNVIDDSSGKGLKVEDGGKVRSGIGVGWTSVPCRRRRVTPVRRLEIGRDGHRHHGLTLVAPASPRPVGGRGEKIPVPRVSRPKIQIPVSFWNENTSRMTRPTMTNHQKK